MDQLFFRHRIRGVTFQKRSPHLGIRKIKTRMPLQFEYDLNELEKALPEQFSREEIRTFLLSGTREMAHHLISEAINHLAHWKQLSRALDEYLTSGHARFVLKDLENYKIKYEILSENDLHLVALEVRTLFRHWQHRLDILEDLIYFFK